LAISRQLPFKNADLLEFTDTVSRVLSSALAHISLDLEGCSPLQPQNQ